MNEPSIYDYLPGAREQLRPEAQQERDYLFDAINDHARSAQVIARPSRQTAVIDLEPAKPTILQRLWACVPG